MNANESDARADDATYFDREFTKRAPRDSPAVAASAGAQEGFANLLHNFPIRPNFNMKHI